MKRVIIIGAGPAGISASLYTARAGIETVVIENGTGALKKTERIENYYGFEYPISGASLMERGIHQAERLGVKFIKEEVVGLGFSANLQVKTEKNVYDTESVIIAMGAPRAVPNLKGIKDFEGKGISYCAVCDAFFNRGKDVAVLGNGKYALNEVKELVPVANSITLLTNGAEPVKGFPAEVEINKAEIAALEGTDRLSKIQFADGTAMDIFSLFVAYGTAGSADMAKKLGIVTNGNKLVVDETMATNVPGVFAAGDCIGGMLQIAAAVHEGAIAGTSVVKYLRAKNGE